MISPSNLARAFPSRTSQRCVHKASPLQIEVQLVEIVTEHKSFGRSFLCASLSLNHDLSFDLWEQRDTCHILDIMELCDAACNNKATVASDV